MGVFSTLKSLFKTSKKPVLKKASKSATPRKAAVAKTPKAAAKAKTPKKSPAKPASAKKAPASKKPKKKAAPESTYLEYVEPSKSKFWMITLDGKTTTVTFGNTRFYDIQNGNNPRGLTVPGLAHDVVATDHSSLSRGFRAATLGGNMHSSIGGC